MVTPARRRPMPAFGRGRGGGVKVSLIDVACSPASLLPRHDQDTGDTRSDHVHCE